MDMNSTQPATNVERCPICGDLPDYLQVWTGQDERFPDAVRKLEWLHVGPEGSYPSSEWDVCRCPSCRALFHWESLPQIYGTGSQDEEKLTRLSATAAAAVDALLSLTAASDDAAKVFAAALACAPLYLVAQIAEQLSSQQPEAFGQAVPALLDHLFDTKAVAVITIYSGSDNSRLVGAITAYCGTDAERIGRVLALVDADTRPRGKYISSLLQDLQEPSPTTTLTVAPPGEVEPLVTAGEPIASQENQISPTPTKPKSEKVLKLTLEYRILGYDRHMDMEGWGDVQKNEYHFIIPAAWIRNSQRITEETRKIVSGLGMALSSDCEIVGYQVNFMSLSKWEREGARKLFSMATDGSIGISAISVAKDAQRLALAQERASKPARKAPCFAETRKNGLNCNRGDLVTIKTLPPVVSDHKKIEIAIKKCAQCWQLYKEYFEVDELTKQSRARFLKPNETDAAHDYHFSSAEAEEYNTIDFRVFLAPSLKNPSLKVAEPTSPSEPTPPLSDFEKRASEFIQDLVETAKNPDPERVAERERFEEEKDKEDQARIAAYHAKLAAKKAPKAMPSRRLPGTPQATVGPAPLTVGVAAPEHPVMMVGTASSAPPPPPKAKVNGDLSLVWKTPQGRFLIKGRRYPLWKGIRLPTGERIRKAAAFYEISSSGEVVNKYSGPATSRLEDYLAISNIHVLMGDTLYRFSWKEQNGRKGELEEEVYLRKCEPYAGQPLPFDADAAIQAYEHRIGGSPKPRLPPYREDQVKSAIPEFVELEALCGPLRQRAQQDQCDPALVERLLTLMDALELAHQTAEDMAMYHEFTDSTSAALSCRQVENHLLAATQDITAACTALTH